MVSASVSTISNFMQLLKIELDSTVILEVRLDLV